MANAGCTLPITPNAACGRGVSSVLHSGKFQCCRHDNCTVTCEKLLWKYYDKNNRHISASIQMVLSNNSLCRHISLCIQVVVSKFSADNQWLISQHHTHVDKCDGVWTSVSETIMSTLPFVECKYVQLNVLKITCVKRPPSQTSKSSFLMIIQLYTETTGPVLKVHFFFFNSLCGILRHVLTTVFETISYIEIDLVHVFNWINKYLIIIVNAMKCFVRSLICVYQNICYI